MLLKPSEVFTPNEYPSYTYVDRASDPLEPQLRRALSVPKEIISISGPSKSGKTVVINRVIHPDDLIVVSGSEIKTSEDLWSRVLEKMGNPATSAEQITDLEADSLSTQVGGGIGIPSGVVKANWNTTDQSTTTKAIAVTRTNARGGLNQVKRDIANSEFVVLIDDFQYISADVQKSVGEQIKTAAENGIRIVVLSVPHRSDDAARSNDDLRGRMMEIDTGLWTTSEVMEIGRLGFERLNIGISSVMLERLARDAVGSPQIMQRICLNVCADLRIEEEYQTERAVDDDEINLKSVMSLTAASINFKTLVQEMHNGPKPRGVERNKFDFVDGSRGDVYRCILLAVSQDPPVAEIPYADLMERVKKVCVTESPVGRSVSEACLQVSTFAGFNGPVEFDKDEISETFHIANPFWLFYLRSSGKLASMAKERSAAS